ncbi:hypothetical protein acdb102_39660 [Acidothermaceae bacterium B102]|nr:hypothetical protein acdb102_39660 [Acidothermaceae bacterium B102]
MAEVATPAPRGGPKRERGGILSEGVDLTKFERVPPPVEATRHNVTVILLWGYLGLLAAVVVSPLVLLLTKDASADDAAKLAIALSSCLSGLAGVLGLTLAFYFKSDASRPIAAPSRKPRTPEKKN